MPSINQGTEYERTGLVWAPTSINNMEKSSKNAIWI